MSRLSIYQTSWIDLVFENKNKEYGAYQLRHESSRTTLTAFFSGILLIASIGVISNFTHWIEKPIIAEIPSILDEPIKITHYVVPQDKPKTPQSTSQPNVQKEPTILMPMIASSTPDETIAIPTNREMTGNQTANNGTAAGTGTSNTSVETIETPSLPIDEKAIINTSQLDKLPEFPGGINKFYNYVGNNFEKPEIDAANTFRVFVYFVIEKDGSMTDIKVLRDPGYGLGNEAVRVLKSLKTKWSPGIINSKAVRTAYSLPITVEMN